MQGFAMNLRRVSLLLVLLFSLVSTTWAERPVAPKLLPDRTVGLLRIRNYPETRKKFGETAMGKILSDPEVGPLLSKLYEQLQDLYSRVEDRVGVPLEKIRSLPQGEIWLAVVPPVDEGPVSLALLIDVGDHLPTARKLIESGQQLLERNGGRRLEETLADTKVNIFLPRNAGEPRRETKKNKDTGKETTELVVELGTTIEFEKDGAVVIATTPTLAEEILRSWDGSETSLAANERFAAVMKRCQTTNDPPEFEWYVDPISLIKALAKGNSGAQVGLALIPALGIDGLQALGGTMTMNAGEFDQVSHMHVLLENPKSGVMEVLQMTSGDGTPEPWVPSDVLSYMTLNWNFQESYSKGSKLYDSFAGDGRANAAISGWVKNTLEVDFEKDLLPAVGNRITFVQWNEPPARLNSGANVLGMQLADAKAFQPIMEKIMAKYPERLEKRTAGSTTYYQLSIPQRPGQDEPPPNVRRPEPCFAILGDTLLASDSTKFLEHCIKTVSTGKTLANEVDFKLVASKISRQAGGQKPGMVAFSRPEEGMRMLYDLLNSDDTKRNLSRQAEQNEVFKRLDDSLKEHPLPPFPVIAKYLAPTGGMMTQDETGFHYMTFTLKRK